jgi:hypothetical protein
MIEKRSKTEKYIGDKAVQEAEKKTHPPRDRSDAKEVFDKLLKRAAKPKKR